MSSRVQLDPELLRRVAREIASETAIKYELYISPGAMDGIDQLVDERVTQLSAGHFDLNNWTQHVRHISDAVGNDYRTRGIRRLTSATELAERVRTLFAVYPYD